MFARQTFRILVLGGFSSILGCDKVAPPSEGSSRSNPPAAAAVESRVRVSGSSALQPLINAAKEKFEAENASASIEVSAGGSKKGLADVSSGAVQIGASDIFAGPNQGELVDHKVAVVGFAAMANKGAYDAQISSLTVEQLAKVFTGAIKNWKELGGDPELIVVINRAPGSGTRTVFGDVVLGGEKFVESQTEDNSGALVAKLKQTPGAISYVALSFQDDELLTLAIQSGRDVIAPTSENIELGRYPIWSYEHLYTKRAAAPEVQKFLDYVLSQDFQTQVLPNVKGFIPITLMKVQKDKD